MGVTHFPWNILYYTSGGQLFDENFENVNINNDEFAAAVQFGADLYKWGVMPSTTQQAAQNYVQRFMSGLAAITFCGAWETPSYWDCDFDWDILPMPLPNKNYLKGYTYDYKVGGDKNVPENLMKEPAREGSVMRYELGSVGFGIYRNTKVPDAAYKLAEFLAYDEDAQRYLYKSGQSVPNIISMAEGEFLTEKLDDPMEKSKGWNRPSNKQVYIDMIHNSKRRISAYVLSDEWSTEMGDSSKDELRLMQVWDLKVVLYDWQTGKRNEKFLKELSQRVQEKYDNKNKKNGEVLFKWSKD